MHQTTALPVRSLTAWVNSPSLRTLRAVVYMGTVENRDGTSGVSSRRCRWVVTYRTLDVDNNRLSGAIPSSLGQLTSLECV